MTCVKRRTLRRRYLLRITSLRKSSAVRNTSDSNGNPVPFTVDDVIETMDDADIVEENEKILLCLRNHVFDITENLQDDRTAKVSVKDGMLPTYITVTADMDGGYRVNTRHIG